MAVNNLSEEQPLNYKVHSFLLLFESSNHNIQREEDAISAFAGVYAGSLIQVKMEFGGSGEKPLEQGKNSNHSWHQAGMKPRPPYWEASILTTTPSLLLNVQQIISICTQHLGISLFISSQYIPEVRLHRKREN